MPHGILKNNDRPAISGALTAGCGQGNGQREPCQNHCLPVETVGTPKVRPSEDQC